MLKLFRKIRLNLIVQGSFKRYFLYALGEVILIVIGVLFALELNNWNNYRINRNNETKILIRLDEELDQSMLRISALQRLVQLKEKALEDVEPFLKGEPIADNRLFIDDVLRAASFGWEQPLLDHITFDEIVGSGNFSLIQDTELRLSISRFFHTVQQREHRSTVRITEFPKITYQYIPRGSSETSLKDDLTEKQVEEITRNLLDSNLRKFLIPELNRARFMRSIWDGMTEEAVNISSMIEKFI